MKPSGRGPRKSDDFGKWFDYVLSEAELLDVRYGVKGFVVYRPNAMKIVARIYRMLEGELERAGHRQVLFPVVIPLSNMKKETEHVKGFEDQVFMIERACGEELQEKLVLRPTSETAVYPMVALWVRSYGHLPLKMYQSVAVYRHETKATRPLLRGREFLWIETHDVFPTEKEAEEQVLQDLDVEKRVCQELGLAFMVADREPWDKFPGAEYSYAYDVPLPDGHVIQIGTTHYLKDKFTKAFDVSFLGRDGKWETPVSTCFGPGVGRMLAAVIATHGDDGGLVLPFGMAEHDVVIVPIQQKGQEESVKSKCAELLDKIGGAGYDCALDDSDRSPGSKFFAWEVKGVPLRVEVGPKEVAERKVTVFRRDTRTRETMGEEDLLARMGELKGDMLKTLARRSQDLLREKQKRATTRAEVTDLAAGRYIIKMGFCGERGCADEIRKATDGYEVRGRALDESAKPSGNCAWCGRPALRTVYVADAY